MNNELPRTKIDERTGIEYRLEGDYYIPNLTMPKQEKITLNKYGRMRVNYLKEHKKAEYSIMLINNELISHLLDIDDICRERIDMLVKQMSEKENVNEELKANNQIKWVQMMNNIKNRVEEIVINEIIYQ